MRPKSTAAEYSRKLYTVRSLRRARGLSNIMFNNADDVKLS